VKVYFISGLAADRRIFKNICLPEGFEPVYLDWIQPQSSESLSGYALRLANKIDQSEKFVLVGMSMGGMIAVEIAKKLHPVLTILISSIPASKHLPPYFRLAARLYLHHLVTIRLMKVAAIAKRFFTTETKEDKEMLKTIIRESDPAFIKWALKAILQWDNAEVPEHLIHIHGSKDEILLIRFTQPTHVIAKAGHMMVMNKASEINEILAEVLRFGPRTADEGPHHSDV
jgi:pimeloyl-ACP methyl ester carboxylesterase